MPSHTTVLITKDGKLVERLVGAPDDVREIEAGLERRSTWLLGSSPLATNRTGGVVRLNTFCFGWNMKVKKTARPPFLAHLTDIKTRAGDPLRRNDLHF